MFGAPNLQPVLETLRTHVALDSDVSEAITNLCGRAGESLSNLLSEANDLATRLEPEDVGQRRSQGYLETWLEAVLRGPHDDRWFDERLRSRHRGWTDLPPATSAVVIGRLRHRLTEIAAEGTASWDSLGARVATSLGRLFDLELALTLGELDDKLFKSAAAVDFDPILPIVEAANLAVGNALGVIETSAFLIRRYSSRIAPGHDGIERHLDRISKHVQQTKVEMGRIVAVARQRPAPTQ